MAAQLLPAREAVAAGEVAARLGDADTVDRGDAVRPALVVVEVGVERLLEREPLDVVPSASASSAKPSSRASSNCASASFICPGAARAHALLRLLAQLLEVELKGHCGSLPFAPGVRLAGRRGSFFGTA